MLVTTIMLKIIPALFANAYLISNRMLNTLVLVNSDFCLNCFYLCLLREAVEHFVTALNHQRLAKAPIGTRAELSESIWPTLRLALTYLSRFDLVEVRDVDMLMKEFNIE